MRTSKSLAFSIAPLLLVLGMLAVGSDARAAGDDIRQFNEFINQGLRQMNIPGLRSHHQLPEPVRQIIHQALRTEKVKGSTVSASTVIEHVADWQSSIRRGVEGVGRPARAVRRAMRKLKGAFSVGIGLVIVTGTAWAEGRQPTALELGGALPIVGLPITFYAVADELISDQVEQTLRGLEGEERAQREADAMRWQLAIALVNHGIRNVGQMCEPLSESSPPPCLEVRPTELVECLDQQLEVANSLVLVDRVALQEKVRRIDAGVRGCFERAITFANQQ